MNENIRVNNPATGKQNQPHLKLQFSHYVESQPESSQAFHRWMNRLEAASLGIIVAAFIVALYLSFSWRSINPVLIPTAWFGFAASGSPLLGLMGLHTVILRVLPPGLTPGKRQQLVTGNPAVWTGLAIILLGLVVAAFWSLFAYAMWTQSWALLTPLINFLGVVMGICIALGMIVGMFNTTIRKLLKTH